jgi:hypothetical protein
VNLKIQLESHLKDETLCLNKGSNLHKVCKNHGKYTVFVNLFILTNKQTKNKLHGLESVSELHRPSTRRLSAKLVPTFADRGCHVVSVMDPYGHILRFLDSSHYFSIK